MRYLIILFLTIMPLSISLFGDAENEEERGLFVDHFKKSPYLQKIVWISDKGDEMILQDGSKWALGYANLGAQSSKWNEGDTVYFVQVANIQSNIIVTRANDGSLLGSSVALLEKGYNENALYITSIKNNGARITLSDGSKWKTDGLVKALAKTFQSGDIVTVTPVKHMFFDDMLLINQTRFPFSVYIIRDKK